DIAYEVRRLASSCEKIFLPCRQNCPKVCLHSERVDPSHHGGKTMPLSLVVFENLPTHEAYPILATQDPAIIALVRRLIDTRLRGAPARPTSSPAGKRGLRLAPWENRHEHP